MTAPIRQRIPLPVGDERGIQLRTGAEQDRDQVTPSVRAWPVELGQAEHSLISGGCCMLTGLPGAAVPGGHQAGARLSRSLRTSSPTFPGRCSATLGAISHGDEGAEARNRHLAQTHLPHSTAGSNHATE